MKRASIDRGKEMWRSEEERRDLARGGEEHGGAGNGVRRGHFWRGERERERNGGDAEEAARIR